MSGHKKMLEQNRPPALMSGENDENARSQILIGVGFVFCLLFDVSSSPPILPWWLAQLTRAPPPRKCCSCWEQAQQQRICCKAPWESVTAMRANMHKISAKMGKIVIQKHNWIKFTAGEEKRRCRANSSAAWLVAARIVRNWTPVDPQSAKWGAQ